DLSQANLQWILNGYTIPFAALLLLGGRMADLVGRRRSFVIGLGVLTLGSLLGGFASGPAILVGARALQGIGAAVGLPAALSLLVTNFHGRERTRAFAVLTLSGGVGLVSAG